jgi:hypothetical protein
VFSLRGICRKQRKLTVCATVNEHFFFFFPPS